MLLDLNPLEAKVAQECPQRAAGIETQVLAARIEIALPRTRCQRERQAPGKRVGGGAEQQRAARAQHAANLRQPAGGVGDVLDHLSGPHHVEGRVGQLPLAFAGQERQLQLGVRDGGAAQRLLGNLGAQHVSAGAGQLGGEPALRAAHVQNPLSGLHVVEQEAPAGLPVARLQTFRQRFPDGLVVGARRHRVKAMPCTLRPRPSHRRERTNRVAHVRCRGAQRGNGEGR